jgi:ferric-dicitrate binding protein FerR (iron transport regulator)
MSQMNDELFLELTAKYLSQEISASERQELLAWVAASEERQGRFDEMIQLWSITNEYVEETFETNTQKAWAKLDNVLDAPSKADEKPPQEAKVISLNRFKIWTRVAAVIAFLGFGYWLFLNPSASETSMATVFQTTENQRKEVQLPDGSTVWLNENTTLRFVDSASINERWVSLEGEAFFDVERNEQKPFTIHAGESVTTVLGTSFNVRAYPQETIVEVTVESGKVKLENKVEEDVQLVAGKSGIYNQKSKKVRIRESKLENANAWRTKKLTFSHAPLNEIAATLERYFDTKIIFKDPELGKCTVNLEEQEAKLDDILFIFKITNDLIIERTDSTIIIDGDSSKCQ